ncbi:MAG: hypothetical protein VZR00_01730 [Lachnospiraceae bacterium]|nr:hypothetical protein [Lachnospiraceae bacterium]MEE3460595.1 hypothetical protein [Lachnospiraceae bacterium]
MRKTLRKPFKRLLSFILASSMVLTPVSGAGAAVRIPTGSGITYSGDALNASGPLVSSGIQKSEASADPGSKADSSSPDSKANVNAPSTPSAVSSFTAAPAADPATYSGITFTFDTDKDSDDDYLIYTSSKEPEGFGPSDATTEAAVKAGFTLAKAVSAGSVDNFKSATDCAVAVSPAAAGNASDTGTVTYKVTLGTFKPLTHYWAVIFRKNSKAEHEYQYSFASPVRDTFSSITSVTEMKIRKFAAKKDGIDTTFDLLSENPSPESFAKANKGYTVTYTYYIYQAATSQSIDEDGKKEYEKLVSSANDKFVEKDSDSIAEDSDQIGYLYKETAPEFTDDSESVGDSNCFRVKTRAFVMADTTISGVSSGTPGLNQISDISGLFTFETPVKKAFTKAPAFEIKNNGAEDPVITLRWDPIENAARYRIYKTTTEGAFETIYRNVSFNDNEMPHFIDPDPKNPKGMNITAGKVYYYKIEAVNRDGAVIASTTEDITELAKGIKVVILPTKPYELNQPEDPKHAGIIRSDKYINLNWNIKKSSFTGFIVYRKGSTDGAVFTKVGIATSEAVSEGGVTSLSYQDTSVKAGTTYSYAVAAYTDTENSQGATSDAITVSTNPGVPGSVKAKGGDGKIRVSWKKGVGASLYRILSVNGDSSAKVAEINYSTINKQRTELKKAGYTQQAAELYDQSLQGVISGLVNDTEYTYKVRAIRKIKNEKGKSVSYYSDFTVNVSAEPTADISTSTKPYTYNSLKKFKKSLALNKKSTKAYMKKTLLPKKSVVIPGLDSTDCNGFESTNMCPQGMTIAKKYMLIGAYDRDNEEHSVIYILNKNTGKFLANITLPDKTHIGGLAFANNKVWISDGKAVSYIYYKNVNNAAKAKTTRAEVNYDATMPISIQASYLTYAKKLVWVGTFEQDKTKTGTLKTFKVKTNDNGQKYLEEKSSMACPPRVQGITVTKNRRVIFSRAYDWTMELNTWTTMSKSGSIYLKKPVKNNYVRKSSIPMPALPEDIEICGSVLYVNFESAVSPKAPDHVDRVIALRLKNVIKKNK